MHSGNEAEHGRVTLQFSERRIISVMKFRTTVSGGASTEAIVVREIQARRAGPYSEERFDIQF